MASGMTRRRSVFRDDLGRLAPRGDAFALARHPARQSPNPVRPASLRRAQTTGPPTIYAPPYGRRIPADTRLTVGAPRPLRRIGIP